MTIVMLQKGRRKARAETRNQKLVDDLVELHVTKFRGKSTRLVKDFLSDVARHVKHVQRVQCFTCCGLDQDQLNYSVYKRRFLKSREDDAARTYSMLQLCAQTLKESIKYAARDKRLDERLLCDKLRSGMNVCWETLERFKAGHFDETYRVQVAAVPPDPRHWKALHLMQAELYRFYESCRENQAAVDDATPPDSKEDADHRPDREANPGPSADVCDVETRFSTQSLTPPPHPPSPQSDAGHASRCPTEGADRRQDPGSPGQRSAPAVDTGPDGTARTDRSSVRASVTAPRADPDSALTSQQSDFTRKVLKTPSGRRKGPSRWEPADDPQTSPPRTSAPIPDPDPSPVRSDLLGDCSSADCDPQTAHQSQETPLGSQRVPPRNSASDTAQTSLTQTPPQLREQSVTSPRKATSPKREPQSSRMDTEESGITAEPVASSNPGPSMTTSRRTQTNSFLFKKYARIPNPKRSRILEMFPPWIRTGSCRKERAEVDATTPDGDTTHKAEGGHKRDESDPDNFLGKQEGKGESDRKEETGASPDPSGHEASIKKPTKRDADREQRKRSEQSDHGEESGVSPWKKLKTV
ncbi:hypothetical protein ACOMHN_060183 [Nucella lapillus]